MIIDFSRAYWYIVVAAVSALFGAALNVLRIYDDSIDEDQQRLIPEEMRLVLVLIFIKLKLPRKIQIRNFVKRTRLTIATKDS